MILGKSMLEKRLIVKFPDPKEQVGGKIKKNGWAPRAGGFVAIFVLFGAI